VVRDDDIISAYEEEFDREAVPGSPDDDAGGLDGEDPASSAGRGFWIVATAMLLAAMFLFVEIFAHRPLVNDIAETENDLRTALGYAERIFAGSGSFTGADAEGLAAIDAGRRYVGPDERSDRPGTVSVFVSARVWAASVQAGTGTCFYLRRSVGEEVGYLVADGECTGREALAADDDRW
jgi:hypothetical protein